ncbi:hypothetical protein CIPAW_10G063300 [Carya illinoinensis]|uniref:Uncharacterized protein n=1 Tax=Carya illinoinensis TaxID=32201 RepID=A0A8T1P4T5_CARIL|nr:hypothetical protein CIPAW_10G063300 [Carya illinoinensis]
MLMLMALLYVVEAQSINHSYLATWHNGDSLAPPSLSLFLLPCPIIPVLLFLFLILSFVCFSLFPMSPYTTTEGKRERVSSALAFLLSFFSHNNRHHVCWECCIFVSIKLFHLQPSLALSLSPVFFHLPDIVSFPF